MKEEKKKIIKLKAELKVYNKMKSEIEKIINHKNNLKKLDDYVFNKIRKIEEDIYNFNFVGEPEESKESTPKYGPGNEFYYNGVKYLVMAVNHKDKTYDLKSSTDRILVTWNLIK